ncbi:hypothetical protein HJO_16160 [Hyphomonas johnsonii MHS-2]|uniref:HIT domain-containing protein n=2 Tax=Hyphomonas johnsonii TaxID=81031 RepID=A0A059FBE3_9PROT|nr:hypothetical protein HJO_16160 [Hyphomonas johnsonii MHS-2]
MNRNATFETFGGMRTLVADYRHWSVQARPRQVTLGAMVLLSHGPAHSFSELPPEAFVELSHVVGDIEATAAATFGYAKINYLMLMMVDPHVHFHVLPRYDAPVEFEGVAYPDPGWPGQPDLGASAGLADAVRVASVLKAAWPKSRV